jgi:hypothetical protein
LRVGLQHRNPLRQEGFPLSAYFSPAVAGSFNPHRTLTIGSRW